MHLVINKRRKRDPQLELKTDYENTVINYQLDGAVLRLNKYSFKCKYDHRTDAANVAVAKKLDRKYRCFVSLAFW